jgi:hypothetical protein
MSLKNKKVPKVINFIGEPSSGKSTAAGALFSYMKQKGYNVELVTEHAKLLSYQCNALLLQDQLYVFSQQNSLLSILANIGCDDNSSNQPLDYIITDSPLYLSCIYGQKNKKVQMNKNYNIILPNSFFNMVMDIYHQYDNATILMSRQHEFKENQGRIHNVVEANEIKNEILDFLNKNKIEHVTFKTQNLDNPNFNLGKQLFDLCKENKIILDF